MTTPPDSRAQRIIGPEAAQQWKWYLSNPLAGLSPTALVAALNNRDAGWLRDFALLYLKLEETDLLLSGLCAKRRSAAARLPWEITINEGFEDDPEAARQQEALNFLYTNLQHRDALDLDHEGGIGSLIEHMMLSVFLGYDVHELIWQPQGADLTVEAVHAHLALFEQTTGRLKYAGPMATLGTVPLNRGEWLKARGQGIGVALAIAAMYKNLTWKDWLAFNEMCSQHAIHGKTSASFKSEQWDDFADALASYGSDFAFLTGPTDAVEFPSANVNGNQSFAPLHEALERTQARIVMGSDLSTLSRREGTGASLQGDDKHMLLEDDARRMSEALNAGIDRIALEYLFGTGTQPLAAFRLIPPMQQDDKLEMEKDRHLRDMGVVVTTASLADKWGVDEEQLAKGTTTATKPTTPTPASNTEALSNAFDPDLHPRDISGKFATKAESGKGNEARRGEMRKGTEADRKRFGIAPAFQDIEVTDDPKADLLWTARDAKGRRKYGYSAAYTESQAAAKFARIGALHKAMPTLRERINEDIALGNDDLHQALTLRLITKTGLRNGGEDGGGDVKAYGASSLLTSHARVDGDKVHLDFIGKEGIRQRHSFTDKILARHITMRQRMENETIFDGDAAQTLDYMKRISGDQFKVHDLRTWYATTNADVITGKLLARGERPKTEKELKAFKKRVATVVSRDLGNGPSMALNNYIHPLVFADAERGIAPKTKEAAR